MNIKNKIHYTNKVVKITILFVLCNYIFCENFDFLYNKQGEIRIQDGSAYFFFNRKGEYTYTVKFDILNGISSNGNWVMDGNALILTGDWSSSNAVTPVTIKRKFKLYIGINYSTLGKSKSDADYVGWHYFESINDINN